MSQLLLWRTRWRDEGQGDSLPAMASELYAELNTMDCDISALGTAIGEAMTMQVVLTCSTVQPITIDNTLPITIDNTLPIAIDNTLPITIENNQPIAIDNTLPITIENNLPIQIENIVGGDGSGTAVQVYNSLCCASDIDDDGNVVVPPYEIHDGWNTTWYAQEDDYYCKLAYAIWDFVKVQLDILQSVYTSIWFLPVLAITLAALWPAWTTILASFAFTRAMLLVKVWEWGQYAEILVHAGEAYEDWENEKDAHICRIIEGLESQDMTVFRNKVISAYVYAYSQPLTPEFEGRLDDWFQASGVGQFLSEYIFSGNIFESGDMPSNYSCDSCMEE